MKETFETIRQKGLLLYEYIRGSHCHGINTPLSDVDTGGVFIAPQNQILGLGLDYQDIISDKKSDNTWYEIGKFMQLLLKSNPTILESLFIDDKFVLYEHPIITELKEHRDKFITKKCFAPFGGYARSQILKCVGYNKKCVNPVTKRLKPLDFAYTFRKQGSTKIEYWLEHRGLHQKYCGLVNIPNMDGMYGVFYDWGNHFLSENITYDDLVVACENTSEDETIEIVHKLKTDNTLTEEQRKDLEDRVKYVQLGNMTRFIENFYLGGDGGFHDIPLRYNSVLKIWFNEQKPIGYKGMVGEDKESNELRLSSVAEGVEPICHLHYNKDKYTSHCRQYREYQQWLKERNEVRYESNKDKTYDAKNVCECFRLINMCTEIANGEGVKVNRFDIDRDFLLDVKNHKYSYEEVMKFLTEKEIIMREAIDNSKIAEEIDVNFVNDFLIKLRNNFI